MGAPRVLFPSHPNLLWPLACSRDLAVNHCWAVTQLWPLCGVRMFVPGWVLLPESDCCLASPTCGHTASCGSSVLLFLCLKVAAAAWQSRQQVAGELGPFRPLGAGCQGERPKPEFQAALLCGHSHRVGKSTSCSCCQPMSVRRALLSLLREKLVWGGSQPYPMASQDRTGTNPTSLSMSYFTQQYFHAKPWA